MQEAACAAAAWEAAAEPHCATFESNARRLVQEAEALVVAALAQLQRSRLDLDGRLCSAGGPVPDGAGAAVRAQLTASADLQARLLDLEHTLRQQLDVHLQELAAALSPRGGGGALPRCGSSGSLAALADASSARGVVDAHCAGVDALCSERRRRVTAACARNEEALEALLDRVVGDD